MKEKNKIFNRLMIFATAAMMCMTALAFFPMVSADTWDVSGNWKINVKYLGIDYLETLVLIQEGTAITGVSLDTDPYNPGSHFVVYDGSVVGNDVDIYMNKGSLVVHMEGTIADDGSMSGTWADVTPGTRTGTWATISGSAFWVDNIAPIITFEEPADGSIQTGLMHLKATCNEICDYVNFWWRAENEPFAWYRYHYVHDDGTVFKWDLDTLNAELAQSHGSYVMDDGIYYLYAAGKDLAGNWARTPEIMVYVINDNLVYGGGHMLEVLDEGDKRNDWLDVSFGGMIGEAGTAGGLVGEWQVNLHNVYTEGLDKSKFHTTEIINNR